MDPSLGEVKSLTPAVHTRVNDLFIDRFGPHAGWAHSLLFAAELPQYADRLPADLRADMEAFREEGRLLKLEQKRAASAAKATSKAASSAAPKKQAPTKKRPAKERPHTASHDATSQPRAIKSDTVEIRNQHGTAIGTRRKRSKWMC